jgi:predicted adenine nucleotide alpha hydrolase (AANH) superfamily ATPase
MKNRINYHKVLQNTIKNIENLESKPKLLLHICCGPCLTIPFEILKDYFDITLFFNNSNIYPKEEYERRLNELKRYLSDIGRSDIPLIIKDYEPDHFLKILEPYKDLKEGYERCRLCFRKRLEEGFEYASLNGFDYFGTVMTISRYKNAQDINFIGENLEKLYPTTKWLYADFKKENGYENSLIICKEHSLYFQEYCGCKYSFLKKFESKK